MTTDLILFLGIIAAIWLGMHWFGDHLQKRAEKDRVKDINSYQSPFDKRYLYQGRNKNGERIFWDTDWKLIVTEEKIRWLNRKDDDEFEIY